MGLTVFDINALRSVVDYASSLGHRTPPKASKRSNPAYHLRVVIPIRVPVLRTAMCGRVDVPHIIDQEVFVARLHAVQTVPHAKGLR